MGDYSYNRLFCIWKQSYAQCVSACLDHRFSVSGMWTYAGRNQTFAPGFCGSMADAPIYLCSGAGSRSICLGTLYLQEEYWNMVQKILYSSHYLYDSLLYLAYVPILSKPPADELLPL